MGKYEHYRWFRVVKSPMADLRKGVVESYCVFPLFNANLDRTSLSTSISMFVALVSSKPTQP